MSSERVTVQVESNIGEDGPLTVADTLHQFMDAFELLSAAIQEEEGGAAVRWRLVSMSKNSPASATGEAFWDDPSLGLEPIIRRGKKRLSDGIAALAQGSLPTWLETHTYVAKKILSRNLNGIGRTTFDLDDAAPRAIIIEKVARAAIATIEKFEADKVAAEADRSRSERGTIDANVAEAKTYYGQPALYVRERLTGRVIPCVLSDRAAQEAGPNHSWLDTWSGKRVRIKGEIFYNKSGEIARVSASSVQDVNPQPVNLSELRQMDITGEKSPVQHLDSLWGYSDE